MRVSAAGCVRPAVSRVRPLRANPVDVVGNRLDVVVDVWSEMLAGLPLVSGTLDDLVKMLNHAGRDERVAVVIEGKAPRIAGPLSKHFKHVGHGMKSPDTSIQFDAFRVGRTRLADVRVRKD